MAYQKLNWKNNKAPYLNADSMNHIDDGILANEALINTISTGENMRGSWTPTVGDEYPDGYSVGDSYYISNVENGYTFTEGDLNGTTVNNVDKIIYTDSGWSAITGASYDIIVDTEEELRLADNGTLIWNDHIKGGIFTYDASKSTEDDGGTILGGWVRQYSGNISLQWFGQSDNLKINLVALEASLNGSRVYCTGNTVSGDGFEGNFIYNDSLSTVNDEYNTINGWVRELEIEIDSIQKTKFIMDFNIPDIDAADQPTFDSFSLQGIEVIGDKLWVVRNLKNNDTGITTGSPEEKCQLFQYDFKDDGSTGNNATFQTNSFKFGHGQSLSHFINSAGNTQLYGMGVTPDGDLDATITRYDGKELIKPFPNQGRTLSYIDWDNLSDKTNPVVTQYQLVAPYDALDNDTLWYFGTPAVSDDGLYVTAIFADMRLFENKKIMVWKLADILAGDYDKVLAEIQVDPEFSKPHKEQLPQGIMIRDNHIFVEYGGWTSTDFRDKILVYDMNLSFVKVQSYFPSGRQGTGYKVEPEGITSAFIRNKKRVVTAYELGSTNRTWEVFSHGEGEGENIPEITPLAVEGGYFDISQKDTSIYRFLNYDESTLEGYVSMWMYQGTPRFRGNSLGMNFRVDSAGVESHDALLYQYSPSSREFLILNPATSSPWHKGTLLLYGENDGTVNDGNILADVNAFAPNSDNHANLGLASKRWNEIFCANSAINTSDERLKDFQDIEDIERLVALDIKKVIKKFKWKDGGKRIHFGVGSQTVASIFREHGLNPDEYSLFTYDEWEATPATIDEDGQVVQPAIEAGNRYGIRYGELAMFILSAI